MRVFGYCREPGVPWHRAESTLTAPWTTPFPRENGVVLRLQGGDVCDPGGWVLRAGASAPTTWFNSLPTRMWRATFRLPCLPFVAFKCGRFGGYFGFKCYGVDSPAYRSWPQLTSDEVYEGSYATCFTVRLSTSR